MQRDKWRERNLDGNTVKYDQTEALRVFHAQQKVRGTNLRQCPGGCGEYLSDSDFKRHQCTGPKRVANIRAVGNEKASRALQRLNQRVGHERATELIRRYKSGGYKK